MTERCFWCLGVPEYDAYHDVEWGFPEGDDQRLFEKLTLEAFQSGLSWRTILTKRANFRAAFAGFDFRRIAAFDERDVERLLADAGIVRHRGKIEATLQNARRASELAVESGSLAAHVWAFEPAPSARPRSMTEAILKGLTRTPESIALSKDLKKRGWSYVGPTTAYAFMQAAGIVNDHTEGCFARPAAEAARAAFQRPPRP